MKLSKFSFVRALLFTACALVLSIGAAQAQSLSGKFTLPAEVHWKSTVLPAGQYDFTVQGSGVSTMLVVRSASTRRAAMLIPGSISEMAMNDSDSLQLTHQGGQLYVTSFEMGTLGLVFHYPAPAATEEAHVPQPTMTAAR